jgi:hypothetical protein
LRGASVERGVAVATGFVGQRKPDSSSRSRWDREGKDCDAAAPSATRPSGCG